MKKPVEISSVTVPIAHFQMDDIVTQQAVVFSISKGNDRIKAIPHLTKEEREQTGLPEEIEFVYYNYCIIEANNLEEETLNAIKQIILELEVQEYFG